MPFIELPLASLYGENPHPRIGNPRVRRVQNFEMVALGQFRRTPGWEETTFTSGPTQPVGANPMHVLDYQDEGSLRLWQHALGLWSCSNLDLPFAGEAIRMPAMARTARNLTQSFIVRASATLHLFCAITDEGDLVYQKVLAPNSPERTTVGEVRKTTLASPAPNVSNLVGYGDMLVASDDDASEVYVLTWDLGTDDFVVRIKLTGVDPVFACATQSASNNAVLLGNSRQYLLINTTTWAYGSWTALTTGGDPVIQNGTLSCSLQEPGQAKLCVGYVSVSGSVRNRVSRIFDFPAMTGGSWSEYATASLGTPQMSVPQFGLGTSGSVAVVVWTDWDTTNLESYLRVGVSNTGGYSHLFGGFAITTPLVFAGQVGTADIFLFCARYRARGGVYSEECLMKLVYDSGYLTCSVIAVLARSARIDGTIRPPLGNVVVDVMMRSDELGSSYGAMFPLQWFGYTSGLSFDLGLVEVPGATWRVNLPTRRPVHIPSVVVGGTALLGGAMPRHAGVNISEELRHFEPPTPTCTYVGVGTTPTAGSRQVCSTWHFRDEAGNEYISTPSEPVTISTTADGTFEIQPGSFPTRSLVTSLNVDFQQMPWQHLWVTEAGGTLFHRATDADGLNFSPFTYSLSDEVLRARPRLYTQGETRGVSGRLPTWAAPAHGCSAATATRIWLAKLENPMQVRCSNAFWPGEGVGWPDSEAFLIDFPEDVVTVQALGDTVLVGTRSSWYMVTGEGPDYMGNGVFGPPVRLNAVCGPIWHGGCCEVAGGLIYQGISGELYRIDRQTLEVTRISDQTRSWVWKLAADFPVSGITNVVVGSATNPTKRWAYLQMRPAAGKSASHSSLIVYDDETQQLYLDTGACAHDTYLDYAFSVWSYQGEPYITRVSIKGGVEVLARRSMNSANAGKDRNDVALSSEIELSDISPWGLGQMGLLHRVSVHASIQELASVYAGGGLSIRLGYDGYETTEKTLTAAEPSSWLGLTSFKFAPTRSRCQSFRVVVVDSTPGKMKDIHALSFEVRPLGTGAERSRAGSSRA